MQRKAEIRIQFKPLPGQLYDAERNELVMRVQPDEAVYLKVHTKEPGLSDKLQHVELNLTYKQRFDVGVGIVCWMYSLTLPAPA